MRAACSVNECDQPRHARGVCTTHYARLRRHGTCDPPANLTRGRHGNPPRQPCRIDGCRSMARAQLLCGKHYQRFVNHGDPLMVVHEKERAYGDTRPDANGYVQIRVPGHPNAGVNGWAQEHRVVMSDHMGRPLFADETVHHRNGHTSDNRIENLELWSSRHPKGQRVQDLLVWAHEVIERYEP